MKSHIKDIMLLGGIYYLGSLILAFLPEMFGELLGIIWVIFYTLWLIKLIWTKDSKVLLSTKEKFPRLSFYLMSIGWMPYIVTITQAILEAIHMIYPDDGVLVVLQNIYIISEYIWIIGFLISLIYATYCVFINKSKI